MKDNDYEITNDEITLLEIVDFFKDSWKKILLGGAVGGTLGAGYALLSPSIYQATAYIQIAQIANTDLEAPSLLVEKLKIPTYYFPNTFVSCNVEDLAEPGKVLANELNPSIVKNSNFISIKYKQRTTEEAKKCLESVLVDIRKNQNDKVTQLLETKKNHLYALKQKLEVTEQLLKTLGSKAMNFDFNDPKFSASTLLLATSLSKQYELKDLRTQITDLELELTEPQTKLTNFVVPIYAPNHSVEPKLSFIALGGIITGFMLVIIFLLVQSFFLNLQKSKPIL